MEFERFEAKFKACVSDAAIRTKFEHHYRQGVEVIGELKELVASEENKIVEKRYGGDGEEVWWDGEEVWWEGEVWWGGRRYGGEGRRYGNGGEEGG